MPLFEFECVKCKNISLHLMLKKDEFIPFCKKCGSEELKKIISRVTIRLSKETRLKKMADPNLINGLEEDDPRAIKKFIGSMESVMDEGFDGNPEHIVDEAMDTE